MLTLWALNGLLTSQFENLSERGWTKNTPENSGLVGRSITALEMDDQGQIWVGTPSGLSVIDLEGKWTIYDSTNSGLVSEAIEALAIDAQGQIWVGQNYGLSVFHKDGSWTKWLSEAPGPLFVNVKALAIDVDGHVWASTKMGDMSIADSNGNRTILHSEELNRIVEEGGANILVQVMGNSLSVYDVNEGWEVYTPENFSLIVEEVQVLASDDAKCIWLGTGYDLYTLCKNEGEENYTQVSFGLVHEKILALAIDKTGRTWLGTSEGLSVIDREGKRKRYTPTNSRISKEGCPHSLLTTGGSCGWDRKVF